MATDVNWSSCTDDFAIYTNIELLNSTPETNITWHVSYTINEINDIIQLNQKSFVHSRSWM